MTNLSRIRYILTWCEICNKYILRYKTNLFNVQTCKRFSAKAFGVEVAYTIHCKVTGLSKAITNIHVIQLETQIQLSAVQLNCNSTSCRLTNHVS